MAWMSLNLKCPNCGEIDDETDKSNVQSIARGGGPPSIGEMYQLSCKKCGYIVKGIMELKFVPETTKHNLELAKKIIDENLFGFNFPEIT